MSLHLPEGSIRNSLARRHGALRRRLALRLGMRAAAGCALVIAIAVVLGALAASGVSAAWIRLVLVAIACLAALAWAVRRFLFQAPGFDTYLEHVEQRFPEVRSWLRNAIDFAQPPADSRTQGTSRELADAVTNETATKLDGLPLESLAPALAPRRPLLAMAAGLAIVVIGTLVAPRAIERSWETLWNPTAAAPPVGLAVEPGSVKVTPGASLTVFARVTGTDQRPRLVREGQKAVEAVGEGKTGNTRLWRFDLAQLTREQDYQVRVVSSASPKYRISLAGEPVPVSFEVEYRAPAYARLPVQRGSALRGDLTALRGTRARVAVTFDRDLTSLASKVPGGTAVTWTPLTARRWQGDIVLDREGEYELQAAASAGEATYRYRMQPLADAPPVIAVRTPEGDVDLPAGQQLPVEVIGQDDLGLTELELEYRKSPSAPWSKLPLARFAERPREAEVRARWDASALAMLPGETATFRFVLYDDAAIGGRNRAESPVFELRFPSLADLYDQVDRSQSGVQKTLEKVADQAKELQKSLDKLSRQQPRAQQSTPAFERSEEMKSSLERQQQLAKQLDQAAQELRESVEKAGEREAFNEELERKLREMAQLMEQIQSKEFREALKRMHEAMENLDRRAMENELPEWRQENREMLQNIERTLELLKKLREEEKLASLAKRAEELKARQDQLNQEHESAEQRDAKGAPRDSKSQEQRAQEAQQRASEQERASQESEQLAADAKEMAQQLDQQQEQQQLNQAAEELQEQAAAPQREAASSAQKMQSGQAKRMGQKASQGLQVGSPGTELEFAL